MWNYPLPIMPPKRRHVGSGVVAVLLKHVRNILYTNHFYSIFSRKRPRNRRNQVKAFYAQVCLHVEKAFRYLWCRAELHFHQHLRNTPIGDHHISFSAFVRTVKVHFVTERQMSRYLMEHVRFP